MKIFYSRLHSAQRVCEFRYITTALENFQTVKVNLFVPFRQ